MTWQRTPQDIANQILAADHATKRRARQEVLSELLDYVTQQRDAALRNGCAMTGTAAGEWWAGSAMMAKVITEKIEQLQQKEPS